MQSLRPPRAQSKQGPRYQLNLGQNAQDGPFLQKDIMQSNSKSSRLVSAGRCLSQGSMRPGLLPTLETSSLSRIQETAPEIYDPKLKKFTNYDEKMRSDLVAAENLTSESYFQYVQKIVLKLKQEIIEYKQMIAKYKSDLKAMHEKLKRDQAEEHKDLIPMVREFMANVIKKQIREENLEVYTLHKELDELDKDKVNLYKQIGFCEKRIADLEKTVGVSAYKGTRDYQAESDDFDNQSMYFSLVF